MKIDKEKSLLESSRFRVVRISQRLEDGSSLEKDVVRHPGAVVILPLLEPDQVCLIRNYRVSLDRHLIELPAGTLEPNEDPAVCAERELIEETGFRAERIQRLRSFVVSPGILDEEMHLFLATGLHPGDTAREAGELIENHIVKWDDAIKLAKSGEIQDAKTLVGLLTYEMFGPP